MPEKRVYKIKIAENEDSIRIIDHFYNKKFEEFKSSRDNKEKSKLSKELSALQNLAFEIKTGKYTPKKFGEEFK